MKPWGVTEDTNRKLEVGEGAFYIEGAMEWWDSWVQMIKDCFRSGMDKEEIREALDVDSNDCFIYWTEFYDDSDEEVKYLSIGSKAMKEDAE